MKIRFYRSSVSIFRYPISCHSTLLEFYDAQRPNGKPHQVAIRALAFKWIRILFRCWKDRQPYDAVKYLLALKKKSSPLVKSLKTEAG
jgi:hypothetical protein